MQALVHRLATLLCMLVDNTICLPAAVSMLWLIAYLSYSVLAVEPARSRDASNSHNAPPALTCDILVLQFFEPIRHIPHSLTQVGLSANQVSSAPDALMLPGVSTRTTKMRLSVQSATCTSMSVGWNATVAQDGACVCTTLTICANATQAGGGWSTDTPCKTWMAS